MAAVTGVQHHKHGIISTLDINIKKHAYLKKKEQHNYNLEAEKLVSDEIKALYPSNIILVARKPLIFFCVDINKNRGYIKTSMEVGKTVHKPRVPKDCCIYTSVCYSMPLLCVTICRYSIFFIKTL
jgi:hypothetical protein